MQVLVLGSGAGGGFPRWNCRCAQCTGMRSGRLHAHARTQSAAAVSVDGVRWVLLNASPDIARQIGLQAALQPRPGGACEPIAAVVLTDAQLDHVAGLLSLREGPPIELYATAGVFEDLTASLAVLPALQHYCGVRWHLLAVAGERRVAGFVIDGFAALRFEAIAIAGAPPPYSSRRDDPAAGDSIALRVTDVASGQCLFFAPGLVDAGADALALMQGADAVLINGGLRAGGAAGAVALLAGSGARRKVLTRIDSDDPLLDEDGAERAELARHGIEIAYDGMTLLL